MSESAVAWMSAPVEVGSYRQMRAARHVSAPPGLLAPELDVRREAELLRVEMTAYVLGCDLRPLVHRQPVTEPATWVQHWKLGRALWTTERHPLASWARRHPRLARPLLRNPAGRWLLRRPLVSLAARRWPVRYTTRSVEVTVAREALFPHAELPWPSPDMLGRPVLLTRVQGGVLR
jgi:hypothetical protein